MSSGSTVASWAASPMRRRTSLGWVAHVEAGDDGRALVGLGQRGEDPDRGGLAGAVGPEDGGDGAGGTSRSMPARAVVVAVALHQAARDTA